MDWKGCNSWDETRHVQGNVPRCETLVMTGSILSRVQSSGFFFFFLGHCTLISQRVSFGSFTAVPQGDLHLFLILNLNSHCPLYTHTHSCPFAIQHDIMWFFLFLSQRFVNILFFYFPSQFISLTSSHFIPSVLHFLSPKYRVFKSCCFSVCLSFGLNYFFSYGAGASSSSDYQTPPKTFPLK